MYQIDYSRYTDLTTAPRHEHEYVLIGDMLCFVDTIDECIDVTGLLTELEIDSVQCYVGHGTRDDIRAGRHTEHPGIGRIYARSNSRV